MKLVWFSLNASFSHDSLALSAIEAQRGEDDFEWVEKAYTLKAPIDKMVRELALEEPTIVAATVWLFNHALLHQVLFRFKILCPQVVIVLGGPEFLGSNHDYLMQNKAIDLVIRGEGEHVFHQWLSVYQNQDQWEGIEGLCYWDTEAKYRDQGIARVSDFTALLPPESSSFFPWESLHIQIETTRGCFNECSFCVSGSDPVRLHSVSSIRTRLQTMVDRGITKIALIDRTFNHHPQRAIELLNLFAEFAGCLSFHLEIHPALLTQSLRSCLASMPQGLLHLEAGVQSLKDEVLKACKRKGNVAHTIDGLRFLVSCPNLILHTDLIAGLPFYSLPQLYQDVCSLSEIGPQEIQLESLKVLPGTHMRRMTQEWGIAYSPQPPYETMASNAMSVEDMAEAMVLSRCLDHYYNHDLWRPFFRLILADDATLLVQLLAFLQEKVQDYTSSLLGQERRADLLYEFCQIYCPHRVLEFAVAWFSLGYSIRKGPGLLLKPMSEVPSVDYQTIKGVYHPYMQCFKMTYHNKELVIGMMAKAHSCKKVHFLAWKEKP